LSPEHRLLEDLAALSGDPLEFVRYAFPWAEPGTELATSEGPEPWQVDLLSAIRDGLLTPERAIQQAIASGHGIGKSAFVSWLILWGISTFEDTRGVVTANTETQLKTKTWAELAKWYRMFIGRELFKLTATAIFSVDPAHERTWRIDMVRWSEHNPEAFAGLHNQGKRILVVFDEASAIHDVIWETTEGALTDRDTQIIWFVAGNPTKNTGRFRGCFDGPQARFWQTRAIDSRTVSFTNKEQIARWIEAYGEDSDFARVRVKGMFPRAGSMQFISSEIVAEAALREVYVDKYDPLLWEWTLRDLAMTLQSSVSERAATVELWPPSVYMALTLKPSPPESPKNTSAIESMQYLSTVAESVEALWIGYVLSECLALTSNSEPNPTAPIRTSLTPSSPTSAPRCTG
jgi:hypothetical protein